MHWELNPQPPDKQSDTLPTELFVPIENGTGFNKRVHTVMTLTMAVTNQKQLDYCRDYYFMTGSVAHLEIIYIQIWACQKSQPQGLMALHQSSVFDGQRFFQL